MSNIVLSIDGTRETNDRMRPRADGSGTYDAIVPKFLKVAESRGQDNYYVRGTFTRENLHFAKDVLHLADLGFQQTSVEPVSYTHLDRKQTNVRCAHVTANMWEG